MKKIVSIFLFLFAFGFANAQSKSVQMQAETKSVEQNSKEIAYKQISEINSVVALTPEMKDNLLQLITMRDESVAKSKSLEEKKAVFERFGHKTLSMFDSEQLAVLKNKPELYKSLLYYGGAE